MRMIRPVSWMLAVLILSACIREPDVVETRSDVQRYIETADRDFKELVREIDFFIDKEIDRGRSLPPDIERFLDWRKREWWRLKEEFAYHIHYDWEIISKLVEDAARYHGYQIENFPKHTEDILNFFAYHTRTEWHNLVMDAVIWVEFNTAEHRKMFKWLKYQYELVDWEVTNLVTDWRMFLQWRKEAYALQASFKDFFDQEIDLVDDFRRDIERFHMLAVVDAGNVVMDFKHFLIDGPKHDIPRLYDEVQRYIRRQPREARLAVASLKRYGQENIRDFPKLFARIRAYKSGQLEHMKSGLAQLNRFFDFYEREYEPLTEDMKRFWRYNILEGRVLIEEIITFYEHEKENAYELKLGAKRFVGYSKVEWKRLKEGWKRFISGEGVAYGSYDLPRNGDFHGQTGYRDLKDHEIKYKTGR